MTAIPGYPGPSPVGLAKQMTTNGVKWGPDIYANPVMKSMDFIVYEQQGDGSYIYFAGDVTQGLLYQILCADCGLYEDPQEYGFPGGQEVGGNPKSIVAQEGFDGMVYKWLPTILANANKRFAPVPHPSDFRTPDEAAAQQVIAFGINNLTVVSQDYPIQITHP